MMICADYDFIVSCIILVGRFSIQHHETNRVASCVAAVVAALHLYIGE